MVAGRATLIVLFLLLFLSPAVEEDEVEKEKGKEEDFGCGSPRSAVSQPEVLVIRVLAYFVVLTAFCSSNTA
jgi:hypothetical protein